MTDAERIAELEAENEWLKSELGMTGNDGPEVLRLRLAFGLTPARGRLLWRLYKSSGLPVSHEALLHAVSPNPADRSPELAKVQVCYLRQAIGAECISSVWGFGYRLTPEGVDKVRIALGEQTESAAA